MEFMGNGGIWEVVEIYAMADEAYEQWGIWAMRHMAIGVYYEQWSYWAMGHKGGGYRWAMGTYGQRGI